MSEVSQRDTAQGFPAPAYAWYVVFIIFIGNTFAFIDRIVVAILTPALQSELALSDSQAGLLQGIAFAMFFMVFGLPLGWIADRWSRKGLLAIGMVCWSVMTAISGAARGFGLLFFARIGVGVGEGTLNPCAASLVGDYFPPRTRPRAFGVYLMGSAVGNGLTFLFGGLLLKWLTTRGGLDLPALGHLKPWQGMFVMVGIGGLIPAILFMTTVREPPRRERADDSGTHASTAQISAFIGQNRVTMICHHLGVGFTVLIGQAFVNWMPTFFLRVHGWEPARFSVTYGSYNVALGIVAYLAGGWTSGRLRARGIVDGTWRVCLVGSIGCTLAGALAPVVASPQLAIALFVVASFCLGLVAVTGVAMNAEFAPNEMRGIITAFYYMMITLVGTGLGPLTVGLVSDHLFHDKAAIGKSLALVSLISGIAGGVLLAIGRRSFAASVSRAHWLTRE